MLKNFCRTFFDAFPFLFICNIFQHVVMSSSGFGMVGFLNKLIALHLIELLNILINYVGFGFGFGLGSAIFGDVYTIGDGLGNA